MLHLSWRLAVPRLPLHGGACEGPPDVAIPKMLSAWSGPCLPRRALHLWVAAPHLLPTGNGLPDAALLLACSAEAGMLVSV